MENHRSHIILPPIKSLCIVFVQPCVFILIPHLVLFFISVAISLLTLCGSISVIIVLLLLGGSGSSFSIYSMYSTWNRLHKDNFNFKITKANQCKTTNHTLFGLFHLNRFKSMCRHHEINAMRKRIWKNVKQWFAINWMVDVMRISYYNLVDIHTTPTPRYYYTCLETFLVMATEQTLLKIQIFDFILHIYFHCQCT